MDLMQHVTLGRTGLSVSRLGVGASYGVPTVALERAYHEAGINYFYWGSTRSNDMGSAIRTLARTDREKLVVAFQSYDRTGVLMPFFHDRGLRAAGLEYADVLILGWHNSYPSPRVLDAALELKAKGKVRFLAMSGHHRPLFGELAAKEVPIDIFMVRYNAVHRGAEKEVFPFLPAENRPGVTCYTATRWGDLLKPGKMPAGEAPLSAGDCYRFVLSHPAVDLCMTGPASEDQMMHAIEALKKGPMDEEELARARRLGDHIHQHLSRFSMGT